MVTSYLLMILLSWLLLAILFWHPVLGNDDIETNKKSPEDYDKLNQLFGSFFNFASFVPPDNRFITIPVFARTDDWEHLRQQQEEQQRQKKNRKQKKGKEERKKKREQLEMNRRNKLADQSNLKNPVGSQMDLQTLQSMLYNSMDPNLANHQMANQQLANQFMLLHHHQQQQQLQRQQQQHHQQMRDQMVHESQNHQVINENPHFAQNPDYQNVDNPDGHHHNHHPADYHQAMHHQAPVPSEKYFYDAKHHVLYHYIYV